MKTDIGMARQSRDGKRRKRRLAKIVLRALAGTLAAAAAVGNAQNYPVKPVRIIVPYPPGGATDIFARILGARLTETLGQQVVVEQRPGAAGVIGAEAAARAAPDG